MKHRRRTPQPAPRQARVKVRALPEARVSTVAAAVFALLALVAVALVKGGPSDGGLANTGSPVSPVLLAVVGLLVVGGIAFLVIGQMRKKKADAGTDVE